MVSNSSIDNLKKGKMVAVAVLVSLMVLVSKITQTSDVASIYNVVLRSALIGGFAYVGLLWALRFQVSGRTLAFVISQSAVFVFCQSLFVELFIFRRVGRVYEVLILLATLVIVTSLSYISFATANIFNVAFFKEIPLIQVGKTSSLILTLLSIYFITYAIFQSGLMAPLVIVLCIAMYLVLTIFHLRHLSIPRTSLWRQILLIVGMMLASVLLLIVIGKNIAIGAFTPVVIFYSMVGVQSTEKPSLVQIFEYFSLTFLAIALNFLIVA